MPELPEVETVKETLKSKIIGKKLLDVNVVYSKIIENLTPQEFKNSIINQKIVDIKRRGKWLMFELNDFYLLSHLRMEGRYYIKPSVNEIEKHEHVIFKLDDGNDLRYVDTRKFGRMYLLSKDNIYSVKPLSELGPEPNDINGPYLKEKYKNIKLPIKTVLLDQSIIAGIGNIYADEILFLSGLNPLIKACELKDRDLDNIAKYTKKVMEAAIKKGGTTIKTYELSKGVHGSYQDELLIHSQIECPICHSLVTKITVNGRGTYYCKKCQK